jgi:UDP-glucose 4-epimerase
MMMEKIMIARAQAQRPGDKTVLCGVRYGNVLLSRGSVVPLFIEQIRRGEAMTVTDPNMTRFLMPLHDAVELVLHALRDGRNGDLFIRKARAATIADLAQACLLLMSAKSPVEVIGIRAGEKMHETLATSEELARADDQGEYWRIPYEGRQEFARFFTEGDREAATIPPFTSDRAEQLSAPGVRALLESLPEVHAILADRQAGLTTV